MKKNNPVKKRPLRTRKAGFKPLGKIFIDGEKLSAALYEKRGLRSLEDAAAEAGVSGNALWRFERQANIPSLRVYAALCAWLGVSTDSFFTKSEPTP